MTIIRTFLNTVNNLNFKINIKNFDKKINNSLQEYFTDNSLYFDNFVETYMINLWNNKTII